PLMGTNRFLRRWEEAPGSDEFDAGHRRVVAVARTELQDPGVAAVALRVAGADILEELRRDFLVAEERNHLTVVVQPALLGLGDDLLGDRTERLGLRLGRGDALGGDERRDEVGHHEALVGSVAAETTALLRG